MSVRMRLREEESNEKKRIEEEKNFVASQFET
jgi:hypothetical protein